MCICNWCSAVRVSRCFCAPKVRSKMNPLAICYYSHIQWKIHGMYALPFSLFVARLVAHMQARHTHVNRSTILTFSFFFLLFSMTEYCALAHASPISKYAKLKQHSIHSICDFWITIRDTHSLSGNVTILHHHRLWSMLPIKIQYK